MKRKIFAIGLAALFLWQTPVLGKNMGALKKDRSTIEAESKKAQRLLDQTAADKEEVQIEVTVLDIALDEVLGELNVIEFDLKSTELALDETEDALVVAIDKRAVQQVGMEERLVYLYKYGSTNYLSVVLESKNVFDLINRASFMGRMIDYDKELFEALRTTEKEIDGLYKDITIKKDAIVVLKNEEEIKKHALEEQVALKIALVQKLENDAIKFGEQLDELEEKSNEIEKLIKQAEADALARQKALEASYTNTTGYTYDGGKLAWPVQGYTSSNSQYGSRKHPISGKTTYHAGEDLRAPYGTNILAADSGLVISSTYMNGYGYTVIIDHGGGLSTLYGHNSKLLVSQGETVSRGQVIALAGSTGYSTGPHLHFEVRINGKHTNPMPYIQ